MTAEAVTEQPLSTPRAKHLTSQTPGTLLRMALCEAEVSQSEVARAWGVHHRVVHDVIRGKKPVTAKRVAALPEAVRDAYYSLRARALGRAWVRLPEVAAEDVTHEALAEYVRDTAETAEAALHLLAEPGCEQRKREVAREFRQDLEKAAAALARLEGE